MPDLRQALKDFVATSNSGKYSDENTLLSKFPELKGYDIDVLRDFVATSNSGKYSTEDEVFSKFPEFKFGQEIKKKEQPWGPLPVENAPSFMESPSELGQSESLEPTKPIPTKVKPEPTESVAVGPMGMTGLQRTAEYKPKQPEPIKPVVAKKIIDETPKETPYYTGKLGVALQAIDTFSPFGVGDFIDDMGRAMDAGSRQGAVVTPSNELMISGKYASPETIQKFITASKAMQNVGPSDEMMSYQKIYEEEGKGIFGVLKGLAKNPGAIPELIMSSYTAMANPTSLAAGGTVVGGAAAGGALFGGAGAVPAAIASAPWAMAAAGTTLETGLTFSELLQDKLTQRGLDFTEENVKKILEDKDALSEIRVKSVARGATIGIIDGLTGRLAGKVGAKLIGNTVASKIKAGLSSAFIESAGGSGGELAGRIVAGQPLDVSEISLEGISQSPSAVIDIASQVMSKPVYKVNGAYRTEEDIQEIINFGTPEDISKLNFDIRNDNKGYKEKIQDIVVTSSIKEQVKEANPNLSEEQLDEVTNLEKELTKFEGNTTQSGKNKAAAIRSQIKTIQDAVQEQATSEVPIQPTAGVSETLAEGEPQAEPQVVAEEVVTPKEEVVAELEKEKFKLTSKAFKQFPQSPAQMKTRARIDEINAELESLRAEPEVVSSKTQEEVTIGEYNPTEEVKDKDMDVLNEVLIKKKVQTEAEPDVTDFGDTVVFEYYDSSIEGDFVTRLTFKKNKNGEIIGRGVKVEKGANRIKETKFFENFVSSQTQATQEVAPVEEVAPVVEVEQYVPILPKQITNEKFTRDNAIDYEEGERETDSGRTVTYLASLTVEAQDDNGDTVGSLTKITDEDGIVSWNSADIDGNELSLDGFDSKDEAKQALVDKVNKDRKKEFDKEAKKKSKFAKDETLQTKGVQPESGVVRPTTKATTKPTGPAVPSRISSKREEVKSSIQRIANAGLLRSAETGKPAITEQEIDAQMALTDAMAKVWEETTGKNDFYDVFIEDVKEGDVDAIAKKGGALFQNVELPQRPITRVSLGVFELPEFQKMKGMSVAPQSISDLMKSRGKQIEKDIVNTVLSYDKYRGQKRISFDEFRDDVETQLMKLERIDTKTYASYGMDNLGGNHTYGESQTIIFNSPIDHGQYGHFRSDFTKGNLAAKTWEIKQIPNTEQYVAIDSDMPSGTPANEMSSYVGTAGPRADVEKWINDRNSITDKEINKGLFGHIRNWFNRNTGVYTLAELQSDYFQKNKANDLYASKISQDEVNEYVNKNFRRKLDNETTEAIKKEFGIVVDYTTNANGDTVATATIKNNPNIPSDYILARNTYSASYIPVSGFTLEDVSENQTVVEALRTLAVGSEVFKDTDVAARRREIVNEYEAKRIVIKKEENKYIASRIEEIKKSDSGNLMVSQFIASQKVHELRLFREALKHAADKGATDLWFPTPYTIAKIEGYISSTGNAPYEIISGDENMLEAGDTIDYGGTDMTVVESNRFSITVAPSNEVSVFNIDTLRDDEANYRMDELEHSLKIEVSDINSITKEEAESYGANDFLSEEILTQLKDYFEDNPEEEVVSWGDIEDKVRTYVEDYYNSASVEDLLHWAGDVYQEGDFVYAVENRRSTERLSQPSEYESTTNEDSFEDDLSDEQSTVVKKYDELGKMIKKMRPDAELVTDDDGNKWIKTAITNADATNPIIAFQEEGGKIKGAIDFSNDNKASIYIFDGADISTLAHEISGHLGRRFIEKLADTNTAFAKDYETAKKWAGVKDNQWSRAAEEKWARGFEKYLRTGKAPSKALKNVFEKFRTWLTNIYKTIKGSSIDVKLTPEIISVFDNLLATKAETKTTVAPAVEEGPTTEDLASIDAMLDLDMEDEDNMLMVLNALDRADKSIGKTLKGGAFESLLAIPLSTVQVVIKALKVLVKGGMMLRDAIRKVAADNNLSQDSVKDILNIAPVQDGFNALMDKVGAMVKRQTSRGTEAKKMVSNVDTLVRNSEVYQNANDAQKKILEREARTQAGAIERRAPSIGRILGVLKDITNVSRKDKLKIISQIRQLSKDASNSLAKEIKELDTQGKITVNQAANIVSRFGKVNMLSEISVSKFVDYMTKVFNDAEYNSKLGTAKSLKKDIKKLSKDKNKNANLRDLGQKFSEIDPSMVEDIDAYNDMASKIKESIKGSSIRTPKVSFADMVNINEASEYINKTLEAQDKAMREEKAAEIQSLMGIDVSELSYDDMMSLLESKEPITKYNEGIIRSTINKAFNIYSSLIKETIATGKDPFTGEDVEFTKSQKDVVKRFMDMDLSVLEPKEALKAVDALANFLQNKSTARMETVVSESMGIGNGKKLYDKGIKAFKLQKYWSPELGRILGEQVTALPVLFEKLFKGFNAGGKVMDMIGLTNLFNKKSSAKRESNIIVENYVKEFYDKQANGEAFNSEYNNIERGMAAFMMRNVIGTESEMNKEFNRRKNLILKVDEDGNRTGAIAELKKGNDKEKAKAELYQRAYDKIVADSKNIKDISSNIDKTNLEAIDYWREQWANKYEQMSDVSQNVYNTVLEKDLNYTPDRVAKLSSDTGVVELKNEDSAFYTNNGILYKEESGSLKKATRPDAFDKKRYIDLSFDNVNANAMYDALVDINTAAPIRQVQAFLNSSYFEEIFPNSDDATIVKKRIQRYVDNTRGKNPYDNDELSKMVKNINRIAAIGVGQALGGLTQPIKQMGPVGINTLFNAGTLKLLSAFNVDTMNFLRESGYAIANRGRESQSQIESVNKLLDQASKSKGAKALKFIEQANEKWIEYLLVKPDGYIARASWITYYEQNLNKQGVDTKNINYKTHELNEEAANYAQRMVDRQQNVSDADLSGQLFSAKEPYKQVLVKILMPLSGFRMNQSTRLGADLATLTNSTSTVEDKKIAAKSVAGFGAELVTFRLIGVYFAALFSSWAKSIMDRDEDEEEKKKRIDNIIKGAKTSTFTDIVSPFPLADKLIQAGGSALLDEIQKTTEIPISIFGPMQQSYVQGAGLFGIPVERALQLWELSKLTTTGKYTDNYGKEKTISEKNQDELKKLVPFAIMTNLGLVPSEVNTVVRYAIKDAKKKTSKTAEEREDSVEKAEDKEESIDQKTEALEKIKSKTRNPNLIEAIDEKIDELDATTEEKKLIKQQNKEERELKQELLTDPNTGEEYDNESKLKKYNKRLWIKNFGPNSDWYKEHRYEKEAESLMKKEIIEMEDKEYRYNAPVKKKRNSDGSLKRTYGKTKRSY